MIPLASITLAAFPPELGWARPLGLFALLLPIGLLLASRLRSRPPTRPTGTVELWRQVTGSAEARQHRMRRRIPPAVWCAAAALVAGGFALAGPRPTRGSEGVMWTVVVDHSPSTALPWRDEAGVADEPGRSRLRRAYDEGRRLLEDRLERADRVRWISSARASLELPAHQWPDEEWLAAPEWFTSAPRWELHRDAGTLWITDTLGAAEPRDAGFVAAGGGAVEGPVGSEGRDRIDWRDGALVTVPDAIGERRVLLGHGPAGEEVPPRLARLFRHWAAGRELTVLEPAGTPPGAVALRFVPMPGTGPRGDVEGGRDGWRARGAALLEPAPATFPASERWLVADEIGDAGSTLVDAAPGVVRVAWRDLDEPAGDPAAFAVSWSTLFDGKLLPPAGIVPLEERRAAGEARVREPEIPVRRAAQRERARARDDRIDAWLSGIAALLALVAITLGLLRGE